MPADPNAPEDGRRHAPAAARNRAPILAVLRDYLAPGARVLEIASGTGEHAVFLAPRLGAGEWWTSDPDFSAHESITAWIAAEDAAMVRAPLALDARAAVWPVPDDVRFDAIVSINMIHIAPWPAAEGLMAGAARHLRPGGILYLYGPFKRGGGHTAPSNAAFDESLKARDPSWGVRDLEEVSALADASALAFLDAVEMPANNLSVVFRLRG